MSSSMFMHQVSFLLTGIFQTLGAQWLHYQGAADKSSFLTILANYFGMTLVLFLKTEQRSLSETSIELPMVSPLKEEEKTVLEDEFPFGPIILSSLIDLSAQACCTAGLFLIGSGIYQVIYSSIVLFTALLSRVILQKMLSGSQWLCLFVIFIGLAISALGRAVAMASGQASLESIKYGVSLTLLGTVFFSCQYVLNERILSKYRIPAEKLCVAVGTVSFTMTTIYVALYTVPRWEELVTIPMQKENASVFYVFLCFGMLILASLFHNISYFKLLGGIGAVSTGVLQALRAISVFFASHVFFCAVEKTQCFGIYKAVSAVIVSIGVVGFSSNKKKK